MTKSRLVLGQPRHAWQGLQEHYGSLSVHFSGAEGGGVCDAGPTLIQHSSSFTSTPVTPPPPLPQKNALKDYHSVLVNHSDNVSCLLGYQVVGPSMHDDLLY